VSLPSAKSHALAAVAAAEPELVAHHLTQAGLVEPAIDWYGKAGDQAVRRSASKEAAVHFGKAIELADELAATTAPDAATSSHRLRLQTSLGNALLSVKGYSAPEVRAAFARAHDLASRVEDVSERFPAYFGLWAGHLTRCEPAPLREMAARFLREATTGPDCAEAQIAYRICGYTCFCSGDFAHAHEHFREALERYDQARHGNFASRFSWDPRAAAAIGDALALWALGRIDEALQLAGRTLADAESAGHAVTLGYVQTYAALLGLYRRNPEAVAACSQAFARIVSRYGLPDLWPGADFFRGWAKWSGGAEASGRAEMRKAIETAREKGHLLFVPSYETALAEADANAGEIDAGLRRLEDARAELERTETRWYEAEMHRTRAGIMLRRDPADTAAAEQSLRTAIAIARSQKARSFELRAALSLAKLYRAAHRDLDARAVLAPAVEGFPPTRQFPELAQAQAEMREIPV
jgi:predicted ATPase